MRILAVILMVVALAGCTSVAYTKPDGTKIVYSRFITSIGSVEAHEGTAWVKVVDSKPDAATIATVLQWLSTVMPAPVPVK